MNISNFTKRKAAEDFHIDGYFILKGDEIFIWKPFKPESASSIRGKPLSSNTVHPVFYHRCMIGELRSDEIGEIEKFLVQAEGSPS